MSRSSSGGVEESGGPSLREIAQLLTTPARSGMVLTKARIGELARTLGLPVGFGEKSQMLMALFRAAADLETVPALVDALRGEVERWAARYQGWAAEYPASASIWADYGERLGGTRALLADMAAALNQMSPGEPLEAGRIPAPVDDDPQYVD